MSSRNKTGQMIIGTREERNLGNVGIGTMTPRSTLHVAGELQITLDGGATGNQGVCGNTTSGDAADTANVLLSDCPGTPASDYMEMYPTEAVEPGDIVATGTTFIQTKDGDNLVKLAKSTKAYQQNIIGIVSDPQHAGDFNSIGYNINETDNPMPIALSGRVKVKVSSISGPIAAGDYLTSSSIPGVAMKSTAAGRVIGIALESFNGETGKILMFVNPHENLAPKVNELALENSQLQTKLSNLESRMLKLEAN